MTLQQYQRKSSFCDDCEFLSLTPPGWIEKFRRDMEVWRQNNVHLFRSDEGLGYN